MRAILLAAGLGTRLKPITDSIPKCLVPINGKPLLKIWLDNLFGAEVERVLINTHYLSNLVEDYLEKSVFKEKVDLFYEKSLLGTAGTLFACKEFVGNESVIVAHADNLSNFNVLDFIRAHKSRPSYCNMTMMLFNTDDPKSCGIVELDEKDVVVGFHEKSLSPPSSLANAAIYIIEPELILEFNGRGQSISDISTQIIPNNLGKIFTYFNDRYHRDIGTLESLSIANAEYRAS